MLAGGWGCPEPGSVGLEPRSCCLRCGLPFVGSGLWAVLVACWEPGWAHLHLTPDVLD